MFRLTTARTFLRRPFVRPSSSVATVPGVSQAPNRETTWSRSQAPRKEAMTGPRFEQTDMALQPNPVAAIDLIAAVPVKMVPGRKVSCDGGGGALGHPKVFLNLDDGEAIACGYCGLRFQKDPDAHHGHH